MSIINVHVVVSQATTDYFDYLLRNYRHCAADPSRLFFFCYALDPAAHAHAARISGLSLSVPVYEDWRAYRKKTLQEWKTFARAMLWRRPLLGGSNGHAAGLNAASRVFGYTAGVQVISDVDAFVVRRGWDEELEELLGRYDLVGAPYEDMGGFSSGSTRVQTYKHFPTAVWVALAERHDWSNLDWMPRKERNVQVDTPEKAVLYGLEQGYEVVCDVGWQLPAYAAERGYRHLALRHVKPSSDAIDVIRTGSDYNEEYQLDGKAFVAHQRGGSRHRFRAVELSQRFFDCLEACTGVPAEA